MKPGIPRFAIKPIFTYSKTEKKTRYFAVLWNVGVPGDGAGHSNRVSLSWIPCLFKREQEYRGWAITLLGWRIHYQQSFGGRFL